MKKSDPPPPSQQSPPQSSSTNRKKGFTTESAISKATNTSLRLKSRPVVKRTSSLTDCLATNLTIAERNQIPQTNHLINLNPELSEDGELVSVSSQEITRPTMSIAADSASTESGRVKNSSESNLDQLNPGESDRQPNLDKNFYSKYSVCEELLGSSSSGQSANGLQRINLEKSLNRDKCDDIYSARLNLNHIQDGGCTVSHKGNTFGKSSHQSCSENPSTSNLNSLNSLTKNSQASNSILASKDVGHSELHVCKSIRNSLYRNVCQVNQTPISNVDSSITGQPHSLANSSSFNSLSLAHCCHNHFHHHHHHHFGNRLETSGSSLFPITSYRQQKHCPKADKNSSLLDFGMSPIQATTIISNHSNTDNSSNSPNSTAAITKLTSSSSSGLPLSTLTVMEMPNLSLSKVGVYNWQAFMPTLKDRMSAIFNREFLSDVHFIVGKGNSQARFPAHKFVLSIGSAVFNAMFNGLLARANCDSQQQQQPTVNEVEKENTEIELPDIEPEAFQALLRFLYLDEVQIGPETVMTTLYAAKKYEILALEMACVDFLKANLSPDNAFMLLTQARLFDETNLADLCLKTIDKHTMDSLFSDSFLDIDLDTLKLVLNRGTLRVREVSLFTNVVRWAETECSRKGLELSAENKRKVLDDALYLIRFPLMNIEEFATNVAQSGLLTDKEVVSLFLHYTVASKPSIPFSVEPRCFITGDECTVGRFQRTESRWGYSGTSDRIRFLTDRPIFVIGFGLFGSIHGTSEYEVMIEIIHTGSGKLIASNNTSFMSDGSDSTFQVMFNSPVEILQNTNYTACATLKGLDSYYGTNGERTVSVNVRKYDRKDIVTFQFSYAAGCNNGTSVEDGQIPEIIFYT